MYFDSKLHGLSNGAIFRAILALQPSQNTLLLFFSTFVQYPWDIASHLVKCYEVYEKEFETASRKKLHECAVALWMEAQRKREEAEKATRIHSAITLPLFCVTPREPGLLRLEHEPPQSKCFYPN